MYHCWVFIRIFTVLHERKILFSIQFLSTLNELILVEAKVKLFSVRQ